MEVCRNLAENIPRRMDAVIKAKGGKPSTTVYDNSLVMTSHWSSAIHHLARWKRWTLILLIIKWKYLF